MERERSRAAAGCIYGCSGGDWNQGRRTAGTSIATPELYQGAPPVEHVKGGAVAGTDMTRWADRAQYVSEAATSTRPVVTLIGATADPLGEIASLTAMYEGRVVRSLSD